MTEYLTMYHYCPTADHMANCRHAEVTLQPPTALIPGGEKLWVIQVLPQHLQEGPNGTLRVYWPAAMSYRPSVKLATQALFDQLGQMGAQFTELLAVPA